MRRGVIPAGGVLYSTMKEMDVLLLWKGTFIAIDLEAHNYLSSYQFFEPQATRPKSCGI
jgi:hypothetical protein